MKTILILAKIESTNYSSGIRSVRATIKRYFGEKYCTCPDQDLPECVIDCAITEDDLTYLKNEAGPNFKLLVIDGEVK